RPQGEHRRGMPHHRGRGSRRGRPDRVGKHACGRRAYLPGRGASGRSDQVLSTTVDLTRGTIESIDSARQIEDILGLPDHLRDALWRVESANLEPYDAPGGLVVAGM